MVKQCKKLSAFADKRELKEAHRIKMEMKKTMRDLYIKKNPNAHEWISANISKHHEHYGDTPQEHEKRKNNT